jgi:hypothetical protein
MPLEDDFLSALRAAFNASAIAASFPGGFFAVTEPISPAYPLVFLAEVREPEPGESLEDRKLAVTFEVHANDLDACKALGLTLTAWLDPNPGRDRLAWATGHELFNVRETGEVTCPDRRAKEGKRVYRYSVPYEFWVTDLTP